MNHTRNIVFRLDRSKKIVFACTIIFFLCLLLLVGFLIYDKGLAEGKQAIAQNKLISADLVALKQALRAEQQRAVSAEKSAEIDRLAAEEVRVELLSHRNELAELQSNIEFYRSLMAPDEQEKGLGLYGFTLTYDQRSNTYQYKALVTQAGNQNRLLKGTISIRLMAESNDLIKGYVLSALPAFKGTLPAKLRFRFFQTIEGSFKLPDDLTPVSMAVELESTGKAAQKINKTFNWQELLGAR